MKKAGAEIPDTEILQPPRPIELRHRVTFIPMSQRPDQMGGENDVAPEANHALPSGHFSGSGGEHVDSDRVQQLEKDSARMHELEREVALLWELLRNSKIKNVICATAKGDETLTRLVLACPTDSQKRFQIFGLFAFPLFQKDILHFF